MSDKKPNEFKVMDIRELSEFLRIPVSSLYFLTKTGKIPAAKVGKHWRYLESDILRLWPAKSLPIIAWFLIVIYSLTELTWAALPVNLTPQVLPLAKISASDLKIPVDLGTIQKIVSGDEGKPVIIHIQDAHAVYDAQQNIRKLIEHFQQDYGIRLVGVEGGAGHMDTLPVRALPDAFLKEQVIEEYAKAGELSGTDLAAILNPEEGAYFGLEDPALYEQNLAVYLKLLKSRERFDQKFREKRNELDRQRENVLSPELNRFFEAKDAFDHEKLGLHEFLKQLRGISDWTENYGPAGRYPHLETIMSELSKSTEISGGTDQAIRKVIGEFQKGYYESLSPSDQRVFNGKQQEFQTGSLSAGEFLQWMMNAGSEAGFLPVLDYSLRELVGRAETLSVIKGTAVFEELNRYLDEIKTSLVRNETEAGLMREYEQLRFFEQMSRAELTREQFEAFKKSEPALIREGGEWLRLLRPALEYYRIAVERDRVFCEKIDRELEKTGQDRVVVVTGGFHTEGFESEFQKQGYSLVVVTPAISSLEGSEHYESVMRGNISYAPSAGGNWYESLIRHIGKNYAVRVEKPELARALKSWRDDIIRRLANENRLDRASRYTKYVDDIYEEFESELNSQAAVGKSKEEIIRLLEEALDKKRTDTVQNLKERFESEWKELENRFFSLVSAKPAAGAAAGKNLLPGAAQNVNSPRHFFPDLHNMVYRVADLETPSSPKIETGRTTKRAAEKREIAEIKRSEIRVVDIGKPDVQRARMNQIEAVYGTVKPSGDPEKDIVSITESLTHEILTSFGLETAKYKLVVADAESINAMFYTAKGERVIQLNWGLLEFLKTEKLLNRATLTFILGHEIGHSMSDELEGIDPEYRNRDLNEEYWADEHGEFAVNNLGNSPLPGLRFIQALRRGKKHAVIAISHPQTHRREYKYFNDIRDRYWPKLEDLEEMGPEEKLPDGMFSRPRSARFQFDQALYSELTFENLEAAIDKASSPHDILKAIHLFNILLNHYALLEEFRNPTKKTGIQSPANRFSEYGRESYQKDLARRVKNYFDSESIYEMFINVGNTYEIASGFLDLVPQYHLAVKYLEENNIDLRTFLNADQIQIGTAVASETGKSVDEVLRIILAMDLKDHISAFSQVPEALPYSHVPSTSTTVRSGRLEITPGYFRSRQNDLVEQNFGLLRQKMKRQIEAMVPELKNLSENDRALMIQKFFLGGLEYLNAAKDPKNHISVQDIVWDDPAAALAVILSMSRRFTNDYLNHRAQEFWLQDLKIEESMMVRWGDRTSIGSMEFYINGLIRQTMNQLENDSELTLEDVLSLYRIHQEHRNVTPAYAMSMTNWDYGSVLLGLAIRKAETFEEVTQIVSDMDSLPEDFDISKDMAQWYQRAESLEELYGMLNVFFSARDLRKSVLQSLQSFVGQAARFLERDRKSKGTTPITLIEKMDAILSAHHIDPHGKDFTDEWSRQIGDTYFGFVYMISHGYWSDRSYDYGSAVKEKENELLISSYRRFQRGPVYLPLKERMAFYYQSLADDLNFHKINPILQHLAGMDRFDHLTGTTEKEKTFYFLAHGLPLHYTSLLHVKTPEEIESAYQLLVGNESLFLANRMSQEEYDALVSIAVWTWFGPREGEKMSVSSPEFDRFVERLRPSRVNAEWYAAYIFVPKKGTAADLEALRKFASKLKIEINIPYIDLAAVEFAKFAVLGSQYQHNHRNDTANYRPIWQRLEADPKTDYTIGWSDWGYNYWLNLARTESGTEPGMEEKVREIQNFYPEASEVRNSVLIGLIGDPFTHDALDFEIIFSLLKESLIRDILAKRILTAKKERGDFEFKNYQDVKSVIDQYFSENSPIGSELFNEWLQEVSVTLPELADHQQERLTERLGRDRKMLIGHSILERVADLFEENTAAHKAAIFKWLTGIEKQKPVEVRYYEYLLKANLNDVPNILANVTDAERYAFLTTLFIGPNGILSDSKVKGQILEALFRQGMKQSPSNNVLFLVLQEIFNDEVSSEAKQFDLINGIFKALLPGKSGQVMSQDQLIAQFLMSFGLVGVKLGQILGYSDLSDNVKALDKRYLLNALRQQDPSLESFSDIATIDQKMGSGSIGQTYLITMKDGRQFIIKYIRPLAHAEITKNLEILQRAFQNLKGKIPGLEDKITDGLLAEIDSAVRKELIIQNEVQNQIKIGKFTRSTRLNGWSMAAPAVHSSLQGKQFFVQEVVPGAHPKKGTPLAANKEAAAMAFYGLLRQMLVLGHFHADWNPGNLRVDETDKTVYLIDYGQAVEFSKANQETLIALMAALDTQDPATALDLISKGLIVSGKEISSELATAIGGLIRNAAQSPAEKMEQIKVLLGKNNIAIQSSFEVAFKVFETLKYFDVDPKTKGDIFRRVVMERQLAPRNIFSRLTYQLLTGQAASSIRFLADRVQANMSSRSEVHVTGAENALDVIAKGVQGATAPIDAIMGDLEALESVLELKTESSSRFSADTDLSNAQRTRSFMGLGERVKIPWQLKLGMEYGFYAFVVAFSGFVLPSVLAWDWKVLPLIVLWELSEVLSPRPAFDKMVHESKDRKINGFIVLMKFTVLAAVSPLFGHVPLVNVFWFLLVESAKTKFRWDPPGEWHATRLERKAAAGLPRSEVRQEPQGIGIGEDFPYQTLVKERQLQLEAFEQKQWEIKQKIQGISDRLDDLENEIGHSDEIPTAKLETNVRDAEAELAGAYFWQRPSLRKAIQKHQKLLVTRQKIVLDLKQERLNLKNELETDLKQFNEEFYTALEASERQFRGPINGAEPLPDDASEIVGILFQRSFQPVFEGLENVFSKSSLSYEERWEMMSRWKKLFPPASDQMIYGVWAKAKFRENWQLVKSHPAAKSLFGENIFSNIENDAAERAVARITKKTDQDDQSGFALLWLSEINPEIRIKYAVPILVNSWTATNPSGLSILPRAGYSIDITVDKFYRFIQSLQPYQRELSPELSEIVQRILDNPDTFYNTQQPAPAYANFLKLRQRLIQSIKAVHPDDEMIEREASEWADTVLNNFRRGDREMTMAAVVNDLVEELGVDIEEDSKVEYVKNPNHERLESLISNLTETLLLEDSSKMPLVLYALNRLHVKTLSPVFYENVGNKLKDPVNNQIISPTLELLFALLKEGRLDAQSAQTVITGAAPILTDFYFRDKLSIEAKKFLALIEGHDIAAIQTLIMDLKFPGYGAHYDNIQDLQNLLPIGNEIHQHRENLLEAVKVLNEFWYEFNPKHTPKLLEWVSSESGRAEFQQIVDDNRLIRSAFPNFRYAIEEHEGALMTDPNTRLVLNFNWMNAMLPGEKSEAPAWNPALESNVADPLIRLYPGMEGLFQKFGKRDALKFIAEIKNTFQITERVEVYQLVEMAGSFFQQFTFEEALSKIAAIHAEGGIEKMRLLALASKFTAESGSLKSSTEAETILTKVNHVFVIASQGQIQGSVLVQGPAGVYSLLEKIKDLDVVFDILKTLIEDNRLINPEIIYALGLFLGQKAISATENEMKLAELEIKDMIDTGFANALNANNFRDQIDAIVAYSKGRKRPTISLLEDYVIEHGQFIVKARRGGDPSEEIDPRNLLETYFSKETGSVARQLTLRRLFLTLGHPIGSMLHREYFSQLFSDVIINGQSKNYMHDLDSIQVIANLKIKNQLSVSENDVEEILTSTKGVAAAADQFLKVRIDQVFEFNQHNRLGNEQYNYKTVSKDAAKALSDANFVGDIIRFAIEYKGDRGRKEAFLILRDMFAAFLKEGNSGVRRYKMNQQRALAKDGKQLPKVLFPVIESLLEQGVIGHAESPVDGLTGQIEALIKELDNFEDHRASQADGTILDASLEGSISDEIATIDTQLHGLGQKVAGLDQVIENVKLSGDMNPLTDFVRAGNISSKDKKKASAAINPLKRRILLAQVKPAIVRTLQIVEDLEKLKKADVSDSEWVDAVSAIQEENADQFDHSITVLKDLHRIAQSKGKENLYLLALTDLIGVLSILKEFRQSSAVDRTITAHLTVDFQEQLQIGQYSASGKGNCQAATAGVATNQSLMGFLGDPGHLVILTKSGDRTLGFVLLHFGFSDGQPVFIREKVYTNHVSTTSLQEAAVNDVLRTIAQKTAAKIIKENKSNGNFTTSKMTLAPSYVDRWVDFLGRRVLSTEFFQEKEFFNFRGDVLDSAPAKVSLRSEVRDEYEGEIPPVQDGYEGEIPPVQEPVNPFDRYVREQLHAMQERQKQTRRTFMRQGLLALGAAVAGTTALTVYLQNIVKVDQKAKEAPEEKKPAAQPKKSAPKTEGPLVRYNRYLENLKDNEGNIRINYIPTRAIWNKTLPEAGQHAEGFYHIEEDMIYLHGREPRNDEEAEGLLQWLSHEIYHRRAQRKFEGNLNKEFDAMFALVDALAADGQPGLMEGVINEVNRINENQERFQGLPGVYNLRDVAPEYFARLAQYLEWSPVELEKFIRQKKEDKVRAQTTLRVMTGLSDDFELMVMTTAWGIQTGRLKASRKSLLKYFQEIGHPYDGNPISPVKAARSEVRASDLKGLRPDVESHVRISLEEVFTNEIRNTKDEMEVTLSILPESDDTNGERMVEIRTRDNGGGINPQVMRSAAGILLDYMLRTLQAQKLIGDYKFDFGTGAPSLSIDKETVRAAVTEYFKNFFKRPGFDANDNLELGRWINEVVIPLAFDPPGSDWGELYHRFFYEANPGFSIITGDLPSSDPDDYAVIEKATGRIIPPEEFAGVHKQIQEAKEKRSRAETGYMFVLVGDVALESFSGRGRALMQQFVVKSLGGQIRSANRYGSGYEVAIRYPVSKIKKEYAHENILLRDLEGIILGWLQTTAPKLADRVNKRVNVTFKVSPETVRQSSTVKSVKEAVEYINQLGTNGIAVHDVQFDPVLAGLFDEAWLRDITGGSAQPAPDATLGYQLPYENYQRRYLNSWLNGRPLKIELTEFAGRTRVRISAAGGRSEVRDKITPEERQSVETILKDIDEVAAKINSKQTFVTQRGKKQASLRKAEITSLLRGHSISVASDFLEILKTYLNDEIPSSDLFRRLTPNLIISVSDYSGRFHLWTQGAVGAFSRHLLNRMSDIEGTTGKKPVVIEVGAGYGDLSHELNKLLPDVRIISTDGFYSDALNEGEILYDAGTIEGRNVKKLDVQDIENGDFRVQLDIAGNVPVIVIASHLPNEGGIDESLFNQRQIDELMIISAYEPLSKRKGTGKIDIAANPDVWAIDRQLLNAPEWLSGLMSLEGPVKLNLETFSRKKGIAFEQPGSYKINPPQTPPLEMFQSQSSGFSLDRIMKMADTMGVPTLGQLLDKLDTGPRYQFKERKKPAKTGSWGRLLNAKKVSSDALLDLLVDYIGATLPPVNDLEEIYHKTSFATAEEAGQFLALLERHVREQRHHVQQAVHREIFDYFEPLVLQDYPELAGKRSEVRDLYASATISEDEKLGRIIDVQALANGAPDSEILRSLAEQAAGETPETFGRLLTVYNTVKFLLERILQADFPNYAEKVLENYRVEFEKMKQMAGDSLAKVNQDIELLNEALIDDLKERAKTEDILTRIQSEDYLKYVESKLAELNLNNENGKVITPEEVVEALRDVVRQDILGASTVVDVEIQNADFEAIQAMDNIEMTQDLLQAAVSELVAANPAYKDMPSAPAVQGKPGLGNPALVIGAEFLPSPEDADAFENMVPVLNFISQNQGLVIAYEAGSAGDVIARAFKSRISSARILILGRRGGEAIDLASVSGAAYENGFRGIFPHGVTVKKANRSDVELGKVSFAAHPSFAKNPAIGSESGFLKMALMIFASPILMKWLEGTDDVSRPSRMTEKAFEQFAQFMSDLAQTQAIRQAVARAA